jgi:ADP-ribose pyrophosphatase YjhB (NUDIX family)
MNITAQLVIINEDGNVLCVSRKDNHEDWGLPGGKMENWDDNNPKKCAIRETIEETGIRTYDLQLVFAIHKHGSMSYTYLAKAFSDSTINHDEPHVVKWGTFTDLMNGSFGEYNKLVHESLIDMGVPVKL